MIPVNSIGSGTGTKGYNVNKAIEHFFDSAGDLYNNPHDVEIIWLPDNALFIATPFPGLEAEHREQACLELGVGIQTYTRFATLFGITGKVKPVMDSISPQQLLAMYEKGKAELYCLLRHSHLPALYFRIQRKCMLVRTEQNETHTLPYLLNTPGEVIAYTRQFLAGYAH